MANELAGKVLAGALPGGALAFALCGVYGYLAPGSLLDNYLMVLFLLLPVRCGVFSLALACRSALRAWGWLGTGNVVAFGLLALLRQWSH